MFSNNFYFITAHFDSLSFSKSGRLIGGAYNALIETFSEAESCPFRQKKRYLRYEIKTSRNHIIVYKLLMLDKNT